MKKELIKQFEEMTVAEGFVHCPSYHDAMVILDTFDGDAVFGYYQYMDEKPEYFLRKLEYRPKLDTYAFRLHGKTWHLNEFMRQIVK